MIAKENIESLDDIEFKLIKEGKLKTNDFGHYVNNKELLEELREYHSYKQECLSKDQPIPPLTNKIGLAIMQIANRRCNSVNYRNYTNAWLEEMIGNAIVTCTLRGHNFDPEKSDNPFAYFTQICDNAIKEQLKREKRQLYIRYKQLDELHGFNAEDDEFGNDEEHQEVIDNAYNDRLQFISDYEQRLEEKKISSKKDNDLNTLDIG